MAPSNGITSSARHLCRPRCFNHERQATRGARRHAALAEEGGEGNGGASRAGCWHQRVSAQWKAGRRGTRTPEGRRSGQGHAGDDGDPPACGRVGARASGGAGNGGPPMARGRARSSELLQHAGDGEPSSGARQGRISGRGAAVWVRLGGTTSGGENLGRISWKHPFG